MIQQTKEETSCLMTFCFGVEFYLDLRLDNSETRQREKISSVADSRNNFIGSCQRYWPDKPLKIAPHALYQLRCSNGCRVN